LIINFDWEAGAVFDQEDLKVVEEVYTQQSLPQSN